jgi:hypothetical protein
MQQTARSYWSRGRCKPLEAGGSAALPATTASLPLLIVVDVVVEIQVHFVQVESRDLFCPKEEQLRERDVLASPDFPIAILQTVPARGWCPWNPAQDRRFILLLFQHP